MPLLDHFHPPLSTARHWEGFHTHWAGSIAGALNQGLMPAGYFAEPQVHVGSRVEIDVATFEQNAPNASGNGGTRTAVLPAKRTWSPPTPTMIIPAVFPDSIEVLVFSSESGPTLVAAIELVSPGNKDRAETRQAFCAKCASYVQQGIGLMVVDIVTSRQANLHNELVRLLEKGEQFLLPAEPLYATSYRPVRRKGTDQIEVWSGSIAVGQALATLPLSLDKGICVPLDLEASYQDACQRSRLP